MEEILREIYSALDDVLRKGAYINIVFNGEFEYSGKFIRLWTMCFARELI